MNQRGTRLNKPSIRTPNKYMQSDPTAGTKLISNGIDTSFHIKRVDLKITFF